MIRRITAAGLIGLPILQLASYAQKPSAKKYNATLINNKGPF